MKLKVVSPYDYSPRMKVGQIVVVDKIRKDKQYEGGYAVRVIKLWKEPKWFAIGWFIEDETETV